MAKVRVYELAKKLGLESKELLAVLNDMGEFVRSASSTIEAPVVRRVSEKLKAGTKPAEAAKGADVPKTDKKKSAPAKTPTPAAPATVATEGAKVGPRATPTPRPVPGPRSEERR